MKPLYYLLFFLSLTACRQTARFEVRKDTGTTFKSKTVFLADPTTHRDSFLFSAPIQKDGSFTLEGTPLPNNALELRLPDDYISIPLFAEPGGTYQLRQEDKNYFLLSEQPQSLQNRYIYFQKQIDSLNAIYNHLCQGYDTINDIHLKAERSEQLGKQFEENNRFLTQGIRQFQGTTVAEYFIYRMLYLYETDYRLFTEVLQAAGDSCPENPMKEKILKSYHQLKAEQLTGQAPDFTLQDIHGQPVSLKDFRGKYILLDFWASWCAPCRKKNKQLYTYYPQLKTQGIEIISISLDNDKQQWIKAVKEDQISWIQLNDPDGFKNSKNREAYKVKQVPTVYLISPTGEILLRNPSLEEIEKALDPKD